MAKQKSNAQHKPQDIDPRNWYYEYDGYIEVIHQVYDINGKYLQTDCIKIKKRKLMKSLERMNTAAGEVREK